MRLSDVEYDLLKEKSARYHMTMNEFLRQMIVYWEIEKSLPLIDDEQRQLFATLMNQIHGRTGMLIYYLRFKTNREMENKVKLMISDISFYESRIYKILEGD